MPRIKFLKPVYKTVLAHIFFWVLALHLIFNIQGLVDSFLRLYSGQRYIDEFFLIFPTALLFFYLNSWYLTPKFFSSQKWRYLFMLSALFLFILGIGTLIFQYFLDVGYASQMDDVVHFFDFSMLIHFIVLGISSSLGISRIAQKEEREKKKIEQLQKATKLNYLDHQLNAHFLYNALNSIYAAAIAENAPQTTEATLKLSEILRYTMQQGNNKLVPLQDEITFIEQYIGFQQIRLGENYPVFFKKQGKVDACFIAPLTLISLVENAFKYGVSFKEYAPISFELNVTEHEIIFASKNNIINDKKVASHKIGIQNLKDRLDILYPQKHRLELDKTKGQFGVSIQLKN
ncbi:sensor histidine kinase [Aureispira anguillae]|nr:sensor histidine kinase [Aureispira anguillae]